MRDWGARNGIEVKIEALENPRKELEEHYYNPTHTGLLDLGLKPHYLDGTTLDEMQQIVLRYKDRILTDVIFCSVNWA